MSKDKKNDQKVIHLTDFTIAVLQQLLANFLLQNPGLNRIAVK